MNDPNGFCYFKGKYHLFYQHNPKAPVWGKMYWGHAVSDDLIKWEHKEIALKPDRFWENLYGCFSGSAVNYQNELNLIYTGFSILGQYQLRAKSTDGFTFVKNSWPVIGPFNLPRGADPINFRDPKVFNIDNSFYLIAGCGLREGLQRSTQLVLYKSEDLEHWICLGSILNGRLKKGGTFECPDYIRLGGKDILIISAMYLDANENHEFENIRSVIWVPGTLDLNTPAFNADTPGVPGYRELDGGSDFYAPQTMTSPDGRTIMAAWMQMWKRTMPTAVEGWAGMMTIPRELSYEDGTLIQKPVTELENYRSNGRFFKNLVIDQELVIPEVSGQHLDIVVSFDLSSESDFGIRFFVSEDRKNFAQLYYNVEQKTLILDRSNTVDRINSLSKLETSSDIRKMIINNSSSKLHMRIILDRLSLEVFIQGGRQIMSSIICNGDEDKGIEFFSEGAVGIKMLKVFDLENI